MSGTVLRRGRVATSLVFLLFGTTLGTWTARIPAVKHRLGLDDGRLSLALLAFAAGAILGMQLIARPIDRYGSRRVLVPLAVAEGLAIVPAALVGSLVALAAALFAFGLVHGALNIAMNANAIDVQRARGRPVMSSFHAVYSIGGFLGALVGGLFAHAGATAAVTFAAVGVAMAGLGLWAVAWRLPDRADVAEAEPASAEHATGGLGPAAPSVVRAALTGVVLLGVLAFCTLVGEGAAADWSAVYLHDDLGSSAGFAAAGYAAFSIMMTVGRLAGDRLAARFGPVRLVRGSALLAAAGLGVALLIGYPIAGVAGFAGLGAGLSCIAPQAFSAAGNRNPARAGRALALVAGVGYAGFLTGPLIIGAAARVAGLPVALSIPVVLSVFVAISAGALRSAEPSSVASASLA
jgi:predicted MFS family arabinose efflux permease